MLCCARGVIVSKLPSRSLAQAFIIQHSQFIPLSYLAWYLLIYFRVGMIYKRTYEGFGHIAVEVYLVPMLLVHVPCSFDALVAVAQVNGIVGFTFKHHEIGAFEVETSEYLTHKAKHKYGLVEGECLVRMGFL